MAWGDGWGGDSRLDREADGESPRAEVPEPVRREPVAEGFGFASWAAGGRSIAGSAAAPEGTVPAVITLATKRSEPRKDLPGFVGQPVR